MIMISGGSRPSADVQYRQHSGTSLSCTTRRRSGTCTQLPHAAAQLASQQVAKGHTVGIADLCGDLVDALAAGSQQMHRTLDAQILEVREGCLAQYALHAPRQGAFTGARCDGRIGEREPVRELLPGPALKALDHWVGMGQVIGDHELSLRAAGLYQQVSRRQSRLISRIKSTMR